MPSLANTLSSLKTQNPAGAGFILIIMLRIVRTGTHADLSS